MKKLDIKKRERKRMWVRIGRSLVPLSFFLASVCLALLAFVSAFSACPAPLALAVGCFFGLLGHQYSFAFGDWIPADVAAMLHRWRRGERMARLQDALMREERIHFEIDSDGPRPRWR